MSAAKKKSKKEQSDGLLPKGLAAKWTTLGYAAGGLGVLAFIAGFLGDQHRFGASYLTGFMFAVTIAIGAIFFVVIQHLTKAGWSVGPRRIMEWMSQGLTPAIILFIPLVAMSHDIWHHWMGEHAALDPILVHKQAYLNPTFFYIRAVFFLLTWALLAHWFYKKSREQDSAKDVAPTQSLQSAAPPAIAALGITSSFAGFDWVMSLDPHWYSTIFGVYIFAGSLVSSMAVLALVIVRLRKDGIGGDLLTVEHQHDVGKFLFGFVVFWAYIGFSQLILIYYANIPEETIFYKHRWDGGWHVVSMALVIGHFVVPFLLLISRTAKRSPQLLTLGAGLIVVMHYVDLFWLVMPNFNHHFSVSWVDLMGLIAPTGVMIAFLAKRVLGDPITPLRDPYAHEAVKAENL